jgi:hypothetical protein
MNSYSLETCPQVLQYQMDGTQFVLGRLAVQGVRNLETVIPAENDYCFVETVGRQLGTVAWVIMI